MSAFKFGLALALMLPFIGFLCRVAVELFKYGYNALLPAGANDKLRSGK